MELNRYFKPLRMTQREHQYHEQVTEVGNVILHRLGRILQRRPQKLTQSVGEYLGARKVREAVKEVTQNQRSRHQVTEQDEAQSELLGWHEIGDWIRLP